MSERRLSSPKGVSKPSERNGINRIATAHLVSIHLSTSFRAYSTGVRSVKLMRMGKSPTHSPLNPQGGESSGFRLSEISFGNLWRQPNSGIPQFSRFTGDAEYVNDI